MALERLRRLIYGGEGHALGPFSLGKVRSLHDYEVYSGFDFANKRAHPDVFTGANPDPVTIHAHADWSRCVTFDEAKELGLLDSGSA